LTAVDEPRPAYEPDAVPLAMLNIALCAVESGSNDEYASVAAVSAEMFVHVVPSVLRCYW
jgi:hypothetical protein